MTSARYLFSLLFTTICCSCGGNDFTVELQNGYSLWKMNANEVYVAEPGGVLVVGPTVVLLNMNKEFVFGLVEIPKRTHSKMEITPGYFLIDTKTHILEKGLSKAVWLNRLKACGISDEPEMKRPTRRFRP